MIQNLIFGFLFFKCYFGHTTFLQLTFVQTFQWTPSEFLLNFRFSYRKSQGQQKLAKEITHFTIQFHS